MICLLSIVSTFTQLQVGAGANGQGRGTLKSSPVNGRVTYNHIHTYGVSDQSTALMYVIHNV